MQRHIYLLCFFVASIATLTSCNGTDPEIEYIPFKSTTDGEWGMVSPTGDVLVSEQFKGMPTMATCGRFFVPNDKGYYELYTTDKTPQRLEGEYRYVSLFYKGKAFVAKRDKPLSIIDKDGNVQVWLEKMEGKKPTSLLNVNEGFAVGVADTVQGLIDTEGKWVIEPRYSLIGPMFHGNVVAQDSKFFNLNNILNDESATMSTEDIKKFPEGFCRIFNTKGEKVLEISSRKYQSVSPYVYGDKIAVSKYVDDAWRAGIINLKGDELLSPSKKYTAITEINGDNFIYINEEGKYGVGSISGKGKTVAPRYADLYWANDDILVGRRETDSDAPEYQYLDSEGTPIITKKFLTATPFIPANRKFAVVYVSEDKATLINRKIERLRDAPRMAAISFNEGSGVLRSDFININEMLTKLNFSETSLDDLTFASSVQTVLARQARYYSSVNKPKASDYTTTSDVNIYRDIDGETIEETIHFPTTLSHRTYTTRTVIDYVDYYWGYYYYHNQTIPTGWAFTTSTPNRFEIRFNNTGIMRGKLKPLLKALVNRFEKYGTVINQNNGAALLSLSAGRKALIAIHSSSLTVEWGNLPLFSSDIAKYADVREDLSVSDLNMTMSFPANFGF